MFDFISLELRLTNANINTNENEIKLQINNNNNKINKLLIKMKGNIENVLESMIKCKWLIITSCCLFISLLSWEIVGDEKGWNKSYWILLMGVGIIIIILIIEYLDIFQKKVIMKKMKTILKK